MRNVTAFLICSKILNVLHQDVVTSIVWLLLCGSQQSFNYTSNIGYFVQQTSFCNKAKRVN